MTSYIGYLDPPLLSNLLLHNQVDLSNHTFTRSRGIYHGHNCKCFIFTIILKPIYSYLARNIKVSEVTPLSEVTPFHGGGKKSENVENAFSGLVITLNVQVGVLTCGWGGRIIKICTKATPALNNRSS